jgi:hypothetical protein
MVKDNFIVCLLNCPSTSLKKKNHEIGSQIISCTYHNVKGRAVWIIIHYFSHKLWHFLSLNPFSSDDELLKINFQIQKRRPLIIKHHQLCNRKQPTKEHYARKSTCVYHFHCAPARTLYLFNIATQNVLSNLRRAQ